MPLIYCNTDKELYRLCRDNPNWEDVVMRPRVQKRPYASDWVSIREGLYYSDESKLYWDSKSNTVYDELSAKHNGLIGIGAALRDMIAAANK